MAVCSKVSHCTKCLAVVTGLFLTRGTVVTVGFLVCQQPPGLLCAPFFLWEAVYGSHSWGDP